MPPTSSTSIRFTGRDEILSASTDSSLRLWAMSPSAVSDSVGGVGGGSASACGRSPHHVQHDPLHALDPVQIHHMHCHQGGCRSGPMATRGSLSRTFQGHTNERNFVGLAVDGDLVACGSETNQVCVCASRVGGSVKTARAHPDARVWGS